MIYEFPVFTGKIEHAQTVCTRPFLLLLLEKGPGDEARVYIDRCIMMNVYSTFSNFINK